ncbi:MAG: heme-binding protein, partial [Pseudomonadota bacterium]|nr:heme-binding protein [Pseudomonadota bacterium]
MSETKLETAVVRPSSFRFGEVSSLTALRKASSAVPSLGPLAEFTGTFTGHGFNTIFRPESTQTPTPLPVPVPAPPSDNILELNLTSETLSFSKSLGSVPNRGMVQGDIFLNGVPYLQTISDVTIPSQPTGIHFEPGLWVIVPATTDPAEGPTLVRMASIPHGTTIEAQGTFFTSNGKPNIPAVDITPFITGSSPIKKITFPSQTATNENTPRIPQNLVPFVAAGTITQAMLTDPNTFLRNHIASQTITSTTTLIISTSPAAPLFGGGTDNIAFLLGDAAALTNPAAKGPNAQALSMSAIFWIETVEHVIHVPIFKPGQPPLTIPGETGEAG